MNIRDELVTEVEKCLVGPRDEEEVLSEPPIDHYTSGILFPRNASTDAMDADDFDSDTEDSETPSMRDLATPHIRQGAIGLRVDIADSIKSVDVEIGYGKYYNNGQEWRRVSLKSNNRHTIELTSSKGAIDICGTDGKSDAVLSWTLNSGSNNNEKYRVFNVFLENARMWREYKGGTDIFSEVKTENNRNAIFQPFIKIDGNKETFRCRRPESGQLYRAEDMSLDLIFRNTKVFGEGSNCAATWDRSPQPSWVSTTLVPKYDAPAIGKESTGAMRPPSVKLHPLACVEQDNDEVYCKHLERYLRPVITRYKEWIEIEHSKAEELSTVSSPHAKTARYNVKRCEEACKRMEEGLEFLLADGHEKERLAFMLANRAMLYQRSHYEYCLKMSRGDASVAAPDPENPKNTARWYPFQIAFFLMNVRGIADQTAPARNEVDLLWFPTGGGKTEAYLAVAAFAMIYRRLRDGDSDGLGTAVIMRYTLRLLTLQQFERASTLMCALEFLRRNNPEYRLGNYPFLLGLWVGSKITPNHWQNSHDAILKLKNNQSSGTQSSPMQLIRCPWCATPMDPYCYETIKAKKWTVSHCGNPSCFFTRGSKEDAESALPVLTVDTDIYRRCPSMIVSTADKFARMPYRPEIASIFGRVEKYCPKHGFLTATDNCGASGVHKDSGAIKHIENLDGPDLIIQDELHLITGALGSMMGLYETAVDYLSRRHCNGKWISPKIIGSTATIRGADDQIRLLFNRATTRKFPPPGIDKEDSFFWWESSEPGRKYVGLSFSHRSSKYSLAKTYAALLQKVKSLSSKVDLDKIDPYWTLVGYFNSIRELGGAIRLVEDDVASNIRIICKHVPEYAEEDERNPGQPHNGLEELTGRVTQDGIRIIREKLEKRMNEKDCISMLLATNMISVGIDIERLGIMVVNGQTKNTAEYIQATGRIGRRPQIPGLVFTLYNPYKPRDLSHYEDFIGHHSKLQGSVEPSTLTPFSPRSTERAVHAVLVAMIRLSIPRLADRKEADSFECEDADGPVNFMLDRYLSVQQVDRTNDGFRYFKKYLESFVDNWTKLIQKTAESSDKGVWYHNTYMVKNYSNIDYNPYVLMEEFSNHADEQSQFALPTPESLRDVEKTLKLEYSDEV